MIKPPNLKNGDTIGITSPARKISRQDIQSAIETLEGWGLKVIVGDTIGKEDHQYAGNDKERQADLQRMLDDPNIKAILSSRGGYGTVRILDNLDFHSFLEAPKWIAGFSDITFLHAQLNGNLGVESLHTTMPITFPSNTRESIQSLKDALFGNPLKYEFPSHPLNRNGVMQGKVIGGNLSILYSILGTKTILEPADSILFIEDLDEYLYHIDRMLIALKRAGKLSNLKGLIVGGMSDMKDNTIPFGKSAEEIIYEHVAEYSYPVCLGFPAGHISDNRAIIMGREAKLVIGESSTFEQ